MLFFYILKTIIGIPHFRCYYNLLRFNNYEATFKKKKGFDHYTLTIPLTL